MKRRWSAFCVLTFVAAALGLIGCGGSGGSGGSGGGSDGGSKSLRVLVTDAPFSFSNVKSATVEIQRIDLHQSGQAEDTLQTLVTFPGGKEIDLVQLQNGVVDTLFEGNPPPGDYDAVRIVVLAKEIVIDDNGTERTFSFKVPSGPQTGIKVFVSPAISVVTGLTRDLVLDFDLSRSFVVQGNPSTPAGIKGFHFKPVVRAVNVSTAGTLTFLVNSNAGGALDGAVCTLTDGHGTVAASGASGVKPTNALVHGYVNLPAIPAGAYTLTVTAAGHDPYTAGVTIVAANLTDLGTLTLATVPVMSGYVTTALAPLAGGAPLEFALPGATIESDGITGTTDTAGGYQLPGLSVGTHSVTIEKDGYQHLSETGTAWSGAPVLSNFALVPLTRVVEGTVTKAGVPVSGATVTASVAYGLDMIAIAQATTGVDGAYALTLPTGSYKIGVVSASGNASMMLDHVGGGLAVALNFPLP